MLRIKKVALSVVTLIGLASSYQSFSQAITYDGSLELEQRIFLEENTRPGLTQFQTSARLSAEFFTQWNDGSDQIVFEPFARLDTQDLSLIHI